MSIPELPPFTSLPVLEHLDRVGPSVAAALQHWKYTDQMAVIDMPDELSDTAKTVEAYGIPWEATANCVVVMGKREGQERIAACVVRGDTRADVNNVVKRLLDVRKCSFLSQDRAVTEASMEYGGITPVGLPDDWRLLIDSRVAQIDVALIGSGVRTSKLLISGELLTRLPGAEVVVGLAS